MNILFQSRKDLLVHPGGDTIQILKTKEMLEKNGYNVDIELSDEVDVSTYDIVHIFNLQTLEYTKKQIYNAKSQNKPVVLSTIWWDFKYIDLDNDFRKYWRSIKYKACLKLLDIFFFINREKRIVYFDKFIFNFHKKKLGRNILKSVDWILPNSSAELEILVRDFDMPELRAKSSIVVNAIDNESFDNSHNEEAEDNKISLKLDKIPDNYILCVGRIEPIKGQAKIIKALMDKKEIPLVFIGAGSDSRYGMFCKKLAEIRGNVFFIPPIRHDLLKLFYTRAKVHVLPSLRESPGLVSLEAVAFDNNIVTSYQAPIWEYFRNDSFVCNPLDLKSIRSEILNAYNSSFNSNLKNYVLRNFTWNQTATQTVWAYGKVLERQFDVN